GFRQRTVELRFVQRDADPILDTPPVFTGEIYEMRCGLGYVELDLRSKLRGWLDGDIPISQIGPIICGQVIAGDGKGAIPLKGQGSRWLLACHEVYFIGVYRRTPDDDDFVNVFSLEYTVHTATVSMFGLDITQSYLDFYNVQPDGTEIRVDVEGIQFRGAWGTLPEISGIPLRNPIDFFINMTYFLLFEQGITDVSTIFATDEISALWPRFEATGDLYSLCDGAIVEDQNAREFLAGFLTSHGLALHQVQTGPECGLLTLTNVNDTDADPPVIHETLIVFNSFKEVAGRRAATEILYRYGLNYATQTWDNETVFTNVPEQDLMGNTIASVRYGKAERVTIDMPWQRHGNSAASVIARRMPFYSIAAYHQTFELPLAEVRDVIELGGSVALTHRLGLQYGGYLGRELKILRTTPKLNTFL